MLLFSTWARNQAENTVDLVYSCYITQPDGHLLVSRLKDSFVGSQDGEENTSGSPALPLRSPVGRKIMGPS